ncbi:MAG TPA: hypothetical protein VHV80_07120 [Steroidobacteraceae bacterium]|nr:hypothetical protein [Steroidobacteraceae bacterium]
MTWLNSGIRAFLLAQGTAARWLRDELDSLQVRILLTDGCIEELAREADQAARRPGTGGDGASYAELLRGHLIVQAHWVRRWTTTDEKAPADDPVAQSFVRIARKYALPRPWKLSEPVAVEVTRPVPAWLWATGCRPQAAGH